MSKTEDYWPTIIVTNGKPYQLVKLERKGVNDPCSVCDLRPECDAPQGYSKLINLCKSDDRDDGWYFEEDWTIFDKPLCDFINPELADDFIDK